MNRCRDVGRRDFLRVGALGALWGGGASAAPLRPGGRARRAILIWLDGGPSHLETWDVKPDAPVEVRGPLGVGATSLPGVYYSDAMPLLAQRADQLAVLRSVTSPLGEHNFGAHYLLTGYRPTPALEYPAIGSVVAHLKGGGVLPGHVAIPRYRVGGGNFSGGAFLPTAAHPFSVGGDPAQTATPQNPDAGFRVRDLDYYPGLDQDRVARRQQYLTELERLQRRRDASDGSTGDGSTPLDPQFEQAFQLVNSPQAKRAFRLDEEPPAVRARYGSRSIGQCCLLARRLLERGVAFVTVNNAGWDTHDNAFTRLVEGYTGARVPVGLIPSLDVAVSALLDDLNERGLLQETLVMIMGEFGRTPKLNTRGGRDHWPRVFSVVLAGAGIRGQVVGASDAVGESPADRPVTPADIAATAYQLLGIAPETRLQTPDGRPILAATGTPLEL